jgi:hypothetical protein
MESLMYHHIEDLSLLSPFKPKAKFFLTRSQKTLHSKVLNLLSSPTLMSPFKPKAKFLLTRSQKTLHSKVPNLLLLSEEKWQDVKNFHADMDGIQMECSVQREMV